VIAETRYLAEDACEAIEVDYEPQQPVVDYMVAAADTDNIVHAGWGLESNAMAAVPFGHHDSVFVSAGTWSLVGMEVDRPLITDATFAANLTNEGGVAGTFRLLRNVTGLWLLHESRRAWADAGHDHSFEELNELATAAPALRAFVDPVDGSYATPGDMPGRIAAFCACTGQPAPEDPGATARCILESIALKHALTVDLLREVTGADPVELHMVGGGARNELLCRWTAQATGLPVLAGRRRPRWSATCSSRRWRWASSSRSRRHARSSEHRSSRRPRTHALLDWDEARRTLRGLVQRKPVEVTS
jgi:rhamnulokinase